MSELSTSRSVANTRSGDTKSKAIRPTRVLIAVASFAVAGVLFVMYPAIRPFSDEASLQGAMAFGSSAWIIAHMLAMVGFTLLPVGLLGLYSVVQTTRVERTAYSAAILAVVGIGLTLPFYGGEAYGLHAIGQAALAAQNPDLIQIAAVVRGGAGLIMFTVGLLTLAAGAIVAAVVVWKSGVHPRWLGIPFAAGFALYLPQFFFSQPVRIAHGLLITLGCLLVAAAIWQLGRGYEMSQ